MPPNNDPPDGAKRTRILIVDDDPSMLVLLPKILARRGFDPATAADADGAEKVLEGESFEAVVMDLQMPARDGFSLAEAVRKRWPDTRIIFVSAYDSEAMRRKAMSLGADAFLAKPIGVEELISHLRSPKVATGQ